MRKKILIALGVLGAVILGFCLVVALQPSTFSVQRTATFAAPPARVFGHINDLKAWDAWSPWKDLDPNPKTSLSSPSAGKGATFSWVGNDQIGEGRLTILASKPEERVDVEQVFVRPLPGRALIEFTLVPAGGGTEVTWKMHGTNGFLGKAVCLFMNMDATIGPSFERGLANMKALVEKGAATAATSAP